MSGFNRKTRHYELTITKALWWSRWPNQGAHGLTTLEQFARALGDAGVKVYAVHGGWLECANEPERIYAALSGYPGFPS